MSIYVPILYSFRRCPYAIRARLALYSMKISHEHREVSLKNKPIELLQISPKGTVPVLQLESGRVFEQSLDIMNWALNTPSLSTKHTNLIVITDSTFKHALDRYKYPGRYGEEEGINYRDQCESFLRELEAELTPFLTGETLALPDMAIFPFIRQFAMVDPDWFAAQNYPRIKTWLNYFMQSELFHQVMGRYLPWSPGELPVIATF